MTTWDSDSSTKHIERFIFVIDMLGRKGMEHMSSNLIRIQ